MSFSSYPAYEESGIEWIGSIPKWWKLAPIKALATCNDDVLDEMTPPDQKIHYVEISDVDAVRGIRASTELAFGISPSRARRCVQHGDVIVSTVRTYLRAIAPVLHPPPTMIVSTGFAVFRPRKAIPGFLAYVFQAEFMIASIISKSVGVSYPAVNASDIGHIKIPVPPLAEQQAIADFLDRETAKINDLIIQQERLLLLIEEKLQAIISLAVTNGLDPSTQDVGDNIAGLENAPRKWKTQRVRHFVEKIEQGWSPQCDGYPVSSTDEWGVLKVGCVNGGIFDPRENKSLPPALEPIPDLGLRVDDVLVSRANTRDLVGSCALVENDHPRLILCDKLYRVRFRKASIVPAFFVLYMRSSLARQEIERQASGASYSMLNIGQDVILNLSIPLPSVKQQEAIVEYVNKHRRASWTLSNQVKSAIALLRERRAGLISAAVTGEIDVRNVVRKTVADEAVAA